MAAPDITCAATPSSREQSGLVAPAWHTAVVVVFLLALTGLSAWRVAGSPALELSSRDRMANYAMVLVWEWVAVAFIAWGVRKRGHRLADLIAGRWPTAGSFFRDLGISLLFLLGSAMVLGSLRWALRDTTTQAVRNLLPDGPAEMVMWVALSATAGFCEETIFRGYLQKQFSRLLHSAGAGLVLQAIVFGACHGYQGLKPMITIGVYGLLFGVLANRVQNLRPGMLAHFLQDSVAGLAGRTLLRHLPAG
jgi:CAAX protease family protein